jgi:hypothetical protein
MKFRMSFYFVAKLVVSLDFLCRWKISNNLLLV